MSTTRFASIASVLLAACATDSTNEPVSQQEAAITEQAVEDTVVTVSIASTSDLASLAASYRLNPCASVETNNTTFVTVTYASCPGRLATTGTIHFELSSLQAMAATIDLTMGGVAIDGELAITLPIDPSKQRTFDGELVITGPRRELTVDATASWLVNGSCVTFDASGMVTASANQSSWEIIARTACR
jgi:hypothetical protein